MSDLKTCKECKQEKPLSEFPRRGKNCSLPRAHCKTCKYKIDRGRYGATLRAAISAWRIKNNERVNEWAREYRKKRPEVAKNALSKWRKNNRPYCVESQRRYYAGRMNATPAWADPKAMRLLYKYARVISQATGIPHQVDHIVPLKSELVCGLHCEANLQVLRATENASKKNYRWPDMP